SARPCTPCACCPHDEPTTPDHRPAWQAGRHLFSTLHVTADAAEGLFVHPNTVRYRLRRIEELTGRSLTDPLTVADLGAALYALRLLPT
ncbi:helix-turn-helix domain-containing protein, partial [Streptomyces sp900105245]|uniref:helix-turn-helix domain-containing protein n=1 Tax=Streptomyces sp. 900105245 TaxID=3154379 RepID=UPI00331B3998